MPKRVTKCKFCGKDLESWQYSYCDDVCRRAFYTTPELRVKPPRVRSKYRGEITDYHKAVMKAYRVDIDGAIKIINESKSYV